jgi:hypothetical protein
MDNRTLFLACDGTTQILGDFHGVGTYCLVKNAEYSSPVAVSVKGIKQALLAPGCALVCRTTMVKVKGPAGSVVELEFVGLSDSVKEVGAAS